MAFETNERAAILALAISLARAAGAIQRERYETKLAIETKSVALDLVTEVDKQCEALIVDGIRAARPHDAILAEEGSGGDTLSCHATTPRDWTWIIDPLDGTTNFAHGYPCFAVSIGIECRGVREIGVVYEPLRDELFHALRGAGAFRNGQPIRVSSETQLDRSMLTTGFAYDIHRSENDNLDLFRRFIKRARALRRDGSAAIDLCFVACGRFDGYWEKNLNPWDVSAGLLLVEEAGGCVSDYAGNTIQSSGAQIVASNGKIHAAMLEILQSSENK